MTATENEHGNDVVDGSEVIFNNIVERRLNNKADINK